MLVYVFKLLRSREYARLDREAFENIYDLLASLLLCGTNDLIKRGFLKSYISQTEELTAIRGRINIGGSIRRLSFQNAKAECTFDEFSADIYFNQVIKATLLLLKHRPVNTNIKHDITKVLMYFNEINTLEIGVIKWDSLVFNRNNAHYDTLLYFCRLICEEAIASQNKGKKNFRVLEDKLLPDLFEKFICEFYKKHLPTSEYKVHYHRQVAWNFDEAYDKPPNMYADTIIESKKQRLIIDTKFSKTTLQSSYRSENQTVKSDNLYQVFSYVINEAENASNKTVNGMLMYPRVDNVAYLEHSLFGHKFYVRTVDLNQEFEAIKRELMNIYYSTNY
jgi:5-methylcytosine-specific restriction enzyme subunit McrC